VRRRQRERRVDVLVEVNGHPVDDRPRMRGRLRGFLAARPQSPAGACERHHPVAAPDKRLEIDLERLPVLADIETSPLLGLVVVIS
jgi:hypothetical protein